MLALALVAVSVGFSNLAAAIGLGVGGVSMATRVRVLLSFGLFEAGMPIVGLLIGSDVATDIGREAKWVGAALLIGVGCYGIFSFVRKLRAPAPALARPDEAEPAPPADTGEGRVPGERRVMGEGRVQGEGRVPDGRQVPGGQLVSGGRRVQSGWRVPGGRLVSGGRRVQSGWRVQGGRRREWIKVAVSAFALSLDNLIAGFALGSYQVNLVTGALVFGFVSIAMSLAGLELGARLGGWVGDSGEMIGGLVLVGVGLAIGFGVLG